MAIRNWDDLRFVLAVARGGTLTRAADALGVDQTTVSRRLTALEEQEGVRLFDRLRRGVELTPAGDAVVRAAHVVEDQMLALDRELAGGSSEIVGPLRLTMLDLMAMTWMPELVGFARRHPRVNLDIVADVNIRNLSRREADVAVRVTDSPPSHLVGRKLAVMTGGVYGHRSLLGLPLGELPWIGWNPTAYTDTIVERTRRRLGATGPWGLHVNTYGLLMDGLAAGAGVTVLPCINGDRMPDVVQVLPDEVFRGDVWLLTHPDLRRSARVRALMDWLGEFIKSEAAALLGPFAEGENAAPQPLVGRQKTP